LRNKKQETHLILHEHDDDDDDDDDDEILQINSVGLITACIFLQIFQSTWGSAEIIN
jgi:hypothetical protein